MKHLSKTFTTLTRLRQHYQEEEEEQKEKEAMQREQQQQQQEKENDSRDDLEDRDFTPLPFHKTSIDVVEFHPEELNDICPLKPEEADELQLADILQGDDLSFLGEIMDDSNTNVPNVPQPNSITMHRIPSDFLVTYDTIGNKRRRLSSMDDSW
mmetsp:Transcript_37964/g.92029  ORF Transcript_37964/g.92029 Transcript_37964/m.92029 type:complete len:154 (+) Transcript_37964:380-841(+)|eukprot:CAMPEP_0113618830 /NCGR_PEP_ID=MMETSP0017_2-20120614/9548_1 /TAXON_ID=2856 /ORGANISM="Cylindrotheca closterium" /LENGTH=153 /DNA_ID=CAMNT_0000528369 /DNA_START=208 /DNA_END=669 /DNA_ORIENTATION=+ /assembly_acc=CAM_ASM_000147